MTELESLRAKVAELERALGGLTDAEGNTLSEMRARAEKAERALAEANGTLSYAVKRRGEETARATAAEEALREARGELVYAEEALRAAGKHREASMIPPKLDRIDAALAGKHAGLREEQEKRCAAVTRNGHRCDKEPHEEGDDQHEAEGAAEGGGTLLWTESYAPRAPAPEHAGSAEAREGALREALETMVRRHVVHWPDKGERGDAWCGTCQTFIVQPGHPTRKHDDAECDWARALTALGVDVLTFFAKAAPAQAQREEPE